MNLLGTSKETTIAGLFGGISIVAGQLQNLFDSDPATMCDMTLITAALAMVVGFWRARDNNRTSESVGAK